MTRPPEPPGPPGPPPGPHEPDDELRELLQHAVADVEPAYRLDAIRARVAAGEDGPSHQEVPVTSSPRAWMVGAAGAVLATAAVIVTFAVVGSQDGDDTPAAGQDRDSSPSASPDGSASEPPEPTESTGDGSQDPAEPVGRETVPAYFTVDTPLGARLVREFLEADLYADGTAGTLEAALRTALAGPAADPDYSSLWPSDTTVAVSPQGQGWRVEVDSETRDLVGVPSGLDEATAEAMRQQVVWTAQAVLQARDPITLATPDGGDVLGRAAGVLDAAPDVEALALMNVTTPMEGQTFTEDVLVADGRSSGFEATVVWEVRDQAGEVIDQGSGTAEGWMDALYPWSVEVDISALEPGTYTFVARNDDPTGGAEGMGDSADTKTFVVE